MQVQDTQSLEDRLREAIRKPPGEGGDLGMTAALRGQHPADIAAAMENLARGEALAVFNWLDNGRAAEVLDELEPGLVRYILDNAPSVRIADLLDRLPANEAAEVISEADPEKGEELLAGLSERSPEDAADVRELLAYDENTAGRLMTDRFIRLTPDMTVDQAFDRLRADGPEARVLSALYVVAPQQDTTDLLVGIVTLRKLIRASPHRKIANIMERDLVTVDVDTDQEEVARTISRYEYYALPVIDRRGRLAGVITIDEVMDVMEEEQTEDVLKLGAVSATEFSYAATGVLGTVRQRFPWLLLLFVAETGTGFVLRHFKGDIARVVGLSFFIPLLVGTGGNAGAQAVTTITRALALGEVGVKDVGRVFSREVCTGLLLGSLLGIFGMLRALLWGTSPGLSAVVGISMVVIVIWAVMVGSLLPLIFKRLHMDPATMSAPFVTTLVDATGLFFYFSIARHLLGA